MDRIRASAFIFVLIYILAVLFFQLPNYFLPILLVLLFIILTGSGGAGGRREDYARIEQWIKVNYGINVQEKVKSGRLYELDSIYSKELSKKVPENNLRGLQEYIRAQKSKKMIR